MGSVRAAKYKGGGLFIGDIYFDEDGFRKFALLEFFTGEGFEEEFRNEMPLLC